jgi:hypothetical protein
MLRSTTEPIVLETIYQLAGRQPPTATADVPHPGIVCARRRSRLVVFVICRSP